MKKILYFLILVLLISSALAVETVFRGEEIRIDLVKIDPSPVRPGENFDIWFDITNIESYSLRNAKFTITTKFPFSLGQGEDTITIPVLTPGEKTSIKFNLKVNNNVEEGNYNLGLQYPTQKSGTVVSSKFDIEVVKSKSIAATNIEVDPEIVSQGETATITFTLENTANTNLKDVEVKLDLSGDLPFAPIGATTEREIALLLQGQKTSVVFDIIALPDADSGIYKIPMNINYYDESGQKFEKESIIGILIGSEPDLSFYIEDTTIYRDGGSTGEIVIKIVNKGLSDVKFLNLYLEENNDFDVISPKEVYIGNVDSDDYETAEYKVRIKRTRNRKVIFPLKVNYRDSNNNIYTRIEEIEFEMRSAKELGIKKDTTGRTIFIILLIILYVYGYRIWRKNNKGGLKDYTKYLYLKSINILKNIRNKLHKRK